MGRRPPAGRRIETRARDTASYGDSSPLCAVLFNESRDYMKTASGFKGTVANCERGPFWFICKGLGGNYNRYPFTPPILNDTQHSQNSLC